MQSFEITLIFFLLVVVFSLLLLPAFRDKAKKSILLSTVLVVLLLVDVFLIIHYGFCYQIGLPASITQVNNEHLTLSSSDWLSFLSGYLGFAGSLVMAYIVYRQSKVIDDLTISEYRPSAILNITRSALSTDYASEDDYKSGSLIKCTPNKADELYYTFYCGFNNNKIQGIEYETAETLIFADIINTSKSPLRNLEFISITIEEINGDRRFEYFNFSKFRNNPQKGINWDPAGKVVELLPENKLRRCFLITAIPSEIKLAWLTINFTCSENSNFITKVLVTKKKKQNLTFLSVPEQI